MSGQLPTSEEEFDAFARRAGEVLRRPAPADGPQGVRSARRRRQVGRVAAGGTAVALLAVGGTALLLQDDGASITTTTENPSTSPATEPSVTTFAPEPTVDTDPAPATSNPDIDTDPTPAPVPQPTSQSSPTSQPSSTIEPTASTAPTTTPTDDSPVGQALSGLAPFNAPLAQAPLSTAARSWLDDRAADGLTEAQLTRTDGTDAVLIATWSNTGADLRSAVMLPDGRIIDTPAGYLAPPYAFSMYAVGGRPVLTDVDGDGTPILWVLDEASGDWTAMAELGIGPVPEGASPIDPFEVQVAGDALLVAYESYLLNADDVWTLTPGQRGVVIRADLSITPIAAPPDGVPMSWTTAIGSTALQLRPRNGGAFDIAPVSGMWAYELDTDTWRRIADPAWLACAGTDLGCKPFPTFEMGDPTLEVATRRGAVQLFDQTVGLYDPGLDEWTRLDDAPFPMALPDTLAMGDQVLVAPMRTFGNEYGLVGVLDLTTGTWTTDQIEFTPDDLARIDRYTDAGWDIRTDGTVVLLSPAQVQRGTNADPVATYDPATRSWSTPTPDDVATWQRFPTIFGNEML